MIAPTKTCQHCGGDYQKKASTSRADWEKSQFCSINCRHEFGRITKKCKQCGKKMIVAKSLEKAYQFCSPDCRRKYMKLHWEEYGGFQKGHESYGAKPWLGKKQSKEMVEKRMQKIRGVPKSKAHREKLSGKNHWNWQGGKTAENHRNRCTVEYNEWRKAVYCRDNWTCRHCDVKQKHPVAHHLKSFNEHPKLRFEVDNGITLCRSCHKKLHAEIGESTRFK